MRGELLHLVALYLLLRRFDAVHFALDLLQHRFFQFLLLLDLLFAQLFDQFGAAVIIREYVMPVGLLEREWTDGYVPSGQYGHRFGIVHDPNEIVAGE